MYLHFITWLQITNSLREFYLTKHFLFFIVLCLSYVPFNANCQSFGFELRDKTAVATIPFEYVNGFIVVEVIFNQTFPLRFIVDTGASNTFVCRKEIIDLFDMPYGRTFELYGADLSTILYAHLVKSVHLGAGNLIAPSQDILVLEEDYFDFQRITGLIIHGVLGADMFRQHAIKINYTKRLLSIYDTNSKQFKHKGYDEVNMVIQKSKPYIVAKTKLTNNTVLDTKLLLDTGAATAILLDTNSDESLTLPDQIIPGRLGFGLGGDIQGYIGRINSIKFGKYTLEQVITRFQDVPKDTINNFVARNGILGNYILDRFTVILDYPNQQLFVKPMRKWKRQFAYDKSGINYISVGLEEKTFYVNSVLEESPADLAGIQSGDIIKNINRKPSIFLTFNGINRILRAKSGKKIKMKIKRGNQIIKTEFRLKDLI